MSAIYGLFNLDGRPAVSSSLRKFSDALAHRGPHGSGYWRDGPVALGHRLLQSTPESRGERQPLIVGGGSGERAVELALSADLRLDNRSTLASLAGASERAIGDAPDVTLLPALYRKHGVGFARLLLGDFAYAIWDARQQRLVLGRDHFGVKPLYYTYEEGRFFAFASEIKALRTLPGLAQDLDEMEVARHLLVPVGDDPTSTYFRHIRRVPPAHTVVVTREGLRMERYWTLDSARELRLSSDSEYEEAVRDAFTEAVRCRLRSTGPVGSMLSGGIDSSSITCVASDLLARRSERLHTYSAVFDDVPASDERFFIEAVEKHRPIVAHRFVADRVSPIGDIDHLNWLGDAPNWGANLYLPWHLSREARRHGVEVMLDGYDGDSTLSHGTGYLRELAIGGHWLRLVVLARQMGHVIGKPWLPPTRHFFRAYAARPALRRVGLEGAARRLKAAVGPRGSQTGRATPGWTTGLQPDFCARLAPLVQGEAVPYTTEREHHHHLMTRSILLHTLNWLEAVGAGAGVEFRFPFFDVRLVELCVSLPPEQKLRRGWSRSIMRRAMGDTLPDAVRNRRDKADLSHSFFHGLRHLAQGRIGKTVASEPAELSQWIAPGYLTHLNQRFQHGQANDEERLRFWRLLSLALWLTAGTAERSPRARMPTGDRFAAEGRFESIT